MVTEDSRTFAKGADVRSEGCCYPTLLTSPDPLAKILDLADDAGFAAIHRAWLEHSVLLFRGTDNIAFKVGAPARPVPIVNSPVWLKGNSISDSGILMLPEVAVGLSGVVRAARCLTNRY